MPWASRCSSRPSSTAPIATAATISSSRPTAPTRRFAARLAHVFKPDIDVRACKYIWLGTRQRFQDAFTFIFEETRARLDLGARLPVRRRDRDLHRRVLGGHLAPVRLRRHEPGRDDRGVRADLRQQPRRASAGDQRQAPARIGVAQFPSRAVRAVVAREPGADGRCGGDRAFLGRLGHEAGARERHRAGRATCTPSRRWQAAFHRYEEERRTEVLRLQSAARNSTEWFEHIERYLHLDPVQFNYSLLTRSQRISHENLRARDKAWLESAEMWFEEQATSEKPEQSRPPMFTPFRLRDLQLKNRIVVSPMAQYRAVDGTPTDWHLVHYAERAKGGAGLVTTEMTCVSPEGRITPGCAGLYAPEHEAAWKRIVDFVHAETDARIGMQLGHSGPKGSTQLGWETMDAPLPEDNWQVIGPSPVAWSPANQVPREMTRADMDTVTRRVRAGGDDGGARRLRSARAALRARLPAVGVHHAADQPPHRRLRRLAREPDALSARGLSRRARGLAERRSRSRSGFPPTTGSATKGITPEEAVEIARLLGDAGVDIINVSAGQTSAARAAGLRPHVPDAVLRSDSQRDRHRHDGGRQHLRARPRELDSDGGPRRPLLPRAAASCRSVLDAACGGAARLSRRDVAEALSGRAAISCTGSIAARRATTNHARAEQRHASRWSRDHDMRDLSRPLQLARRRHASPSSRWRGPSGRTR